MKEETYSIRLAKGMKDDLKAWADQYGAPVSWLVERVLASALQAHSVESTQSSLPVNGLPHLPTLADRHAYQVESGN